MHTYITIIWEVEASGSCVQGQPELYSHTLHQSWKQNKTKPSQPTNQLTNQTNPKTMTKRWQVYFYLYWILSLVEYLQYHEIRQNNHKISSVSYNHYCTLGCKSLQTWEFLQFMSKDPEVSFISMNPTVWRTENLYLFKAGTIESPCQKPCHPDKWLASGKCKENTWFSRMYNVFFASSPNRHCMGIEHDSKQ